MRKRQLLVLIIGLLTVGLVASGCSSDDSEASPDTEYAAIIDVRTPAEYAESHVDGAININVEDPSFDAEIAQLDPDGTYLVYCRSGNRSAAAADRLEAAGFDVVDGGGLDAMDSAGFTFVQG